MAVVKTADQPRFLASGWKSWPVIVCHGSDEGAVREAVSRLSAAALGPDPDPLNLIMLDGDTLAQDPGRLADELKTFGLFGGFRVIQLRASARLPAHLLETAADEANDGVLLIVEAADLKRDSALRQKCERHKRIAVLAFYADTARMLAGLIDDMLKSHDLSMTREAREVLTGALGADRGLSRSELDKLAIYASGAREITAEMVLDIVADAGRHETGALIDAAFAGDLAVIEPEANRIFASGVHPSAILSLAIGQALLLRRGLRAAGNGAGADEIGRALRIHFSRIQTFGRMLALWTDTRLEPVLKTLADATALTRRTPRLAGQITIRALWSVARLARPPRGR